MTNSGKVLVGDRQTGQALPLGIAAILFTAILTLTLFNTGQITSEKMRLTNAADAAAYSGLVWQARALNFQSYTNRAMVANQVAIAQMVSLVSWSNYLRVGARNIAAVTSWIPGVNAATRAFAESSQYMNSFIYQTAQVAVPIMDALISAMSASQPLVHQAATVTTHAIVRNVVARNDPNFELSRLSLGWLVHNAAKWNDFTDNYSSDDRLIRKADIISDSRDGFTKDRGWSEGMVDVGIFKVKLVKGGETKLIREASEGDYGRSKDVEWEWKGKDTLSIHTKYWGCSWSGCGWRHNEIPVGWGSAYVTTGQKDLEYCENSLGWSFSFGCPSWSDNKIAERLAEIEKTEIHGHNGVRAYREIADLSDRNKDPRLALAVEVTVPGGKVRTSSHVNGLGSPNNPAPSRNGIGQGMLRVNDGFASTAVGGQSGLSTVSKGEVYFRRPEARVAGKFGATDSLEEYGNLFNPYWGVRLVKADDARIQAWASKGLGDISSVGGGGQVGRQ